MIFQTLSVTFNIQFLLKNGLGGGAYKKRGNFIKSKGGIERVHIWLEIMLNKS